MCWSLHGETCAYKVWEKEALALLTSLRSTAPKFHEHLNNMMGSVVLRISVQWWWASQKQGQDGEEDQLIFSCPRLFEMRPGLRETSWCWRGEWWSLQHPFQPFTVGELLHKAIFLLQPSYLWEEGMVVWCLQLSDDPWRWNRSLHSPHSILVKTIFKAEQAASLLQLSKQGPRLTLFYTHLLVDTTQLWSLHRAKGQFGWLPVFIWVSNQHLYLATAKIEFFISSILSVNGLTMHLIQVLSFPYPYPYSQSSQTQLISKLAQWYLKNSKMVHVAAFSWFCPWPGATSSLWKYSNSPQTGGTTLTPLPTHKPGKSLNTMNQMVSFPC